MIPATETNQTMDNQPPSWKIKALQEARNRCHFESFDLFPSSAKSGSRIASLARSGLIESVGSYPSRATKWEITLKGLQFIKDHEQAR